MPRYSNPRRRSSGLSITLPKVLTSIAVFVMACGVVAALLIVLNARPEVPVDEWDASLLWWAFQVLVGSLIGGLVWYVTARALKWAQ